jgi:hypothetical protein
MSSTKTLRVLWLCFSVIISTFDWGLSSLPAGTMIATSSGLVPIEKLKVGNKVLSYNFGAQNPKDAIIEVAITKVDKHLADSIFTLHSAKNRWVEASPQQLFFTIKTKQDQLSDTSAVELVKTQYITTDSMLIDVDLRCVPIVRIMKTELSCSPQQYIEKIAKDKHNKIKSITTIPVHIDMYAIEVEEPHTFLISDSSYDEHTWKPGEPRLFLTHNGIPALGVGLSLAFGSTPASISFAEATLSAGGIGAALGPAGIAVGVITSLGFLGYQLYKNKDEKQSSFYLERSDPSGASGGNDPKDPKDNKDGEWKSPQGLIYGHDKKFGNRIQHVLAHASPDPNKITHSVFNVAKDKIPELVDEAWLKRSRPLASDPGAYVIDMEKVIGTKGEEAIKIIVKPGTAEIITAYPVKL